jgi:hypothetical protein
VKPRFAVEAHLNGLFDTGAEEPVDEAEQQKAQKEPPGGDPPVQLPVSFSPAAYKDLSQHNAQRHDWIEEEGAQDRRVKGRNYQRIADQNLKRLLKKRGWGRRPCPSEAVSALFLAAFGWLTYPFLEYWSFPHVLVQFTL